MMNQAKFISCLLDMIHRNHVIQLENMKIQMKKEAPPKRIYTKEYFQSQYCSQEELNTWVKERKAK